MCQAPRKQFKGLEVEFSFDAHSVFSARRKDELALKLISGIPVVRAWGLSPHLDPLIDRCLSKLANASFVDRASARGQSAPGGCARPGSRWSPV
jgi:hypothetical protein